MYPIFFDVVANVMSRELREAERASARRDDRQTAHVGVSLDAAGEATAELHPLPEPAAVTVSHHPRRHAG
jgi:hypothetical protein